MRPFLWKGPTWFLKNRFYETQGRPFPSGNAYIVLFNHDKTILTASIGLAWLLTQISDNYNRSTSSAEQKTSGRIYHSIIYLNVCPSRQVMRLFHFYVNNFQRKITLCKGVSAATRISVFGDCNTQKHCIAKYLSCKCQVEEKIIQVEWTERKESNLV